MVRWLTPFTTRVEVRPARKLPKPAKGCGYGQKCPKLNSRRGRGSLSRFSEISTRVRPEFLQESQTPERGARRDPEGAVQRCSRSMYFKKGLAAALRVKSTEKASSPQGLRALPYLERATQYQLISFQKHPVFGAPLLAMCKFPISLCSALLSPSFIRDC